jgi:hypothetical protein
MAGATVQEATRAVSINRRNIRHLLRCSFGLMPI